MQSKDTKSERTKQAQNKVKKRVKRDLCFLPDEPHQAQNKDKKSEKSFVYFSTSSGPNMVQFCAEYVELVPARRNNDNRKRTALSKR